MNSHLFAQSDDICAIFLLNLVQHLAYPLLHPLDGIRLHLPDEAVVEVIPARPLFPDTAIRFNLHIEGNAVSIYMGANLAL